MCVSLDNAVWYNSLAEREPRDTDYIVMFADSYDTDPVDLKQLIPERDWDEAAYQELKDADTRLFLQYEGNFTIAILHSKHGAVAGVAKRNPNDDPYDRRRGEEIAVIRAWRAFKELGW